MKLSEFDYDLPKSLIAQHALPERTEARLLVLDRSSRSIQDNHFIDIVSFLKKDDVLVLNDTKVLPARLFGKRKTGARIEILLLKSLESENEWEALVRPSGRVKKGEMIELHESPLSEAELLDDSDGVTGIRHLRIHSDKPANALLEQIGHIPLPPYIDREDSAIDRTLYQTVFAQKPGAVASPTAGLHFDENLLTRIRAKGVEIVFVTLHVSYGTFQPVVEDDVTRHQMYLEDYEIPEEAAEVINMAKSAGRRIIACGTTVVRTLESSVRNTIPTEVKPGRSATRLFIYPPYEFKMVDGMITNFHLPRTTLLMLVSAFTGHDLLMEAYRHAVNEQYRFFSYGDAMFIS